MDKKEEVKKNWLKLLRKHQGDIKKMVDVCEQFKIPYLTPAYRNLNDVVEQLIKDFEKTEVK